MTEEFSVDPNYDFFAREKWDKIYSEAAQTGGVAEVLLQHQYLLPTSGVSLDLACGLGGNAMLLARRGMESHAWDISPVAIERVLSAADAAGLVITARACDVVVQPPAPASFDVIVVGYFLERTLFPALRAALRPGGLLFYQTYTRSRIDSSGPSSERFRLADNELLHLCHPLRIVVYRDEGLIGDTRCGLRNTSFVVAQQASQG